MRRNLAQSCIAHVSECLKNAVDVSHDWEYKAASSADVAIYERLQKRRTGRTRVPVVLKRLQEIISPQPEAMRVIKRLLSWIDRVDWCSQRGEGKPAFATPEGDPIFPPPDADGEPSLWWLTDFSRDNARLLEQKKKKEAEQNWDSAEEDFEDDTDSNAADCHETDNIDDSQSSVSGSRAYGDVDFSKNDSAARANHAPSLCWQPSQEGSQTDVTPPSQPVFNGYFERQIAARCGVHALNNAIGFCFATAAELSRACDAFLREHPYDSRAMHEAPTGWYSN